MNVKASTRQLQGAGKGLRRLAASVWWGDSNTQSHPGSASAGESRSLERYISGVFQSLAVFRLATFALGAGLVFFLNPSDQRPLVLGLVVLLVGTYNVFRVIWRFVCHFQSPAH